MKQLTPAKDIAYSYIEATMVHDTVNMETSDNHHTTALYTVYTV